MKKANKVQTLQGLIKILKKRRKELGVTQQQLAEYCNLSRNGIVQLEGGEKNDMKLSTLLKVSTMLGLNILIEEDD